MTVIDIRGDEITNVTSMDVVPVARQCNTAVANTNTALSQLSAVRQDLAIAIETRNPRQMLDAKARAVTVADAAKELKVSKEIQLDAITLVRRAERLLGVLIREGQAAGKILSKRTNARKKTSSSEERVSQYAFAARSELYGKFGKEGIYAMTDGITDEVFEDVITTARAEDKEMSLSRVGIARKCIARKTSEPQPEPEPESEPIKPVRKTARARRLMELLEVTIHNLMMATEDELSDPNEVDYQAHRTEIEQMFKELKTIRGFLNQVKHQPNTQEKKK